MKLTLNRTHFSPLSTQGTLSLDGVVTYFTLELPVKDGLPGSAIPLGTYPVTVYPSPKFGRLMPLIMGIPLRSNIEIHWGNTAHDTDGCVLIGQSTEPDEISGSRAAFNAFWAAVQGPLEQGQVTITVSGQPAGEQT